MCVRFTHIYTCGHFLVSTVTCATARTTNGKCAVYKEKEVEHDYCCDECERDGLGSWIKTAGHANSGRTEFFSFLFLSSWWGVNWIWRNWYFFFVFPGKLIINLNGCGYVERINIANASWTRVHPVSISSCCFLLQSFIFPSLFSLSCYGSNTNVARTCMSKSLGAALLPFRGDHGRTGQTRTLQHSSQKVGKRKLLPPWIH